MVGEWHQIELHFPPAGVVEVVAQFAFEDGRVLWQRLPARARNHFDAASGSTARWSV